MAEDPIIGTSLELTSEDQERRAIVSALLRAENPTIIDFAKHLVTVAFAAVGVVVTFADKWLGASASIGARRILLAAAIVLMLAAAAFAAYAASASTYRVSLSDYDDVDHELHRVARRRYGLARAAMLLLIAAIVLLSGVALWSSG